MRQQDGRCIICNEVLVWNDENIERDHIVAKALGGKDTFKNLALLHKECHAKKTAFDRRIIAKFKAEQRAMKEEAKKND